MCEKIGLLLSFRNGSGAVGLTTVRDPVVADWLATAQAASFCDDWPGRAWRLGRMAGDLARDWHSGAENKMRTGVIYARLGMESHARCSVLGKKESDASRERQASP